MKVRFFDIQDFFRLFMIPGMGHCGGDGAWVVDYLSYLEDWVENGNAPDSLLAAHPINPEAEIPLDPPEIKFTCPVYPYPVRAIYKGDGDSNEAAHLAQAGCHNLPEVVFYIGAISDEYDKSTFVSRGAEFFNVSEFRICFKRNRKKELQQTSQYKYFKCHYFTRRIHTSWILWSPRWKIL